MGHRVARGTGSPFPRHRALALALAALVALVGGPGMAATTPSQGRPPALAAATTADPIARAAIELDFDAEQIFRFVADEIRYEPYAGLLRGPHGTLAAGAGNSVDKAALLAALLDASMVSYRFARGSLDEATTARIIDALPADAAASRAAVMDPLQRGADEFALSQGTTTSEEPPVLTDEEVQAIEAEGAQRLELTRSRLDATVAMLSDALDGAGIELPAGTDVSLPAAEVSDHTWVEMRDGATWVPLDPTLTGMQPGEPLATASETLDQLPDDLRYRIAFDVLVERVEGGQLASHSVLQYEDFADRLAGLPVSFAHVTPSGMQQIGISLGALFGGGFMDYRPVIDLGDRSIVADEAVAIPTGQGGDIFSVDPLASPGVPVEGEATAEWLELRVTPPGSDPVVARRTIFDRLAPGARHVGTPMVEAVEPVTLVDVEGTGTLDYAPMLGVETFAIATGPTSAGPVISAAEDGLGMAALVYHNLRDLIGAGIALDAGSRAFIDGPNIVSLVVEVHPETTTPEGTPDLRVGFDIWHRSHGTLPLTTPVVTSAQSELVAGVTDQLAERFAMEYLAGTASAASRSVGVGSVFEAAAAQGIPTLVLHDTVPTDLPFQPEAAGAIGAAVAAGEVVVVPAEPVTLDGAERVGWWSIDPASGETRDVMDDGSGSEFGEYGVVIRSRVGLVRCYGSLAAMAAAQIMMATSTIMALNVIGMWKPGVGPGGTACLGI